MLNTLATHSSAISEHDTHFAATDANVLLRANITSPSFLGTVSMPNLKLNGTIDTVANVLITPTEVSYLSGLDTSLQSSINRIDSSLILKAPITNAVFQGVPQCPDVSANSLASCVVNKKYVDDRVASLVNGASSTLDTLSELAAALGNDNNFSTTVTALISTKAPLASPSFSGNVTCGALAATDVTLQNVVIMNNSQFGDNPLLDVVTVNGVSTFNGNVFLGGSTSAQSLRSTDFIATSVTGTSLSCGSLTVSDTVSLPANSVANSAITSTTNLIAN
jgi:energy-converting hydrogenase Eha subunit B